MIRGTLEHPKFLDLQARLDQPRYVIAGLLECLWHFTARYAPQGDVGRWPNVAIARALEWDGDADELIEALVGSGWLNSSDSHRLLVHDYPEHADDAVQRQLARSVQCFADGTRPKTTRLSPAERERINKKFNDLHGSVSAKSDRRAPDVRPTCARCAHEVRPTPPHPTSEEKTKNPAPPAGAASGSAPGLPEIEPTANSSRPRAGVCAPSARASPSDDPITAKAAEFCSRFVEALVGREARFKRPTPSAMRRWEQQARLMLRERGAEADQIASWLFTDESDEAGFWRGTVLSVPGMRKHFDKLRAQKQRSEKRRRGGDSLLAAADRVRHQLRQESDE